jgi:hypothetical protein
MVPNVVFELGDMEALETVIHAQQKKRTCGLGEILQHSTRFKLAPERVAEWFSHSHDPQLSFDGTGPPTPTLRAEIGLA